MDILDKAVPPNCPERQILVGSKTVVLLGGEIKVGQAAPEFAVQANDWSSVGGLASTAGKIRVLASIPSLSTPTCEREIRRFNERIEDFGDAVHVLVISADLPVTQKTWCGNAGVERVQTVSDHIDMDFALKYGTYVKGRRFHYRAVFVVGKDDKVVYATYMPGLDVEPNYDEVLAAVRTAR